MRKPRDKTLPVLRKSVLLGISLALWASCGSLFGTDRPNPVPAPLKCQVPEPPAVPESLKNLEDLCPDSPDWACLSTDTLVDLAVYQNAVQRTLDALNTCPQIEWYP
jgi:hypothetical protein